MLTNEQSAEGSVPVMRPTTTKRLSNGQDEHSRASRRWLMPVVLMAIVALVAAGCSSGSDEDSNSSATVAGQPVILVTTGIWSDIVSNVACGGIAEVETLIPVGGDPHGYEPSLQDRARMENADLVVANGLALEEGLEDTLEAVAESGTPVYEFAEMMETIPFSFEFGHGGEEGDGHGDEEEDGHGDEDDDEGHGDEEEDGHGDEDDDEGHGDEEEDGHGDEDDDEGHGDEEEDGHGDEDDDEGHGDEEEDGHGDEDDDEGHGDEDDDEGHGDEEEDGHGDEDEEEDGHGDEGHGHGSGGDPHVWFDPRRVYAALPDLAELLHADIGLDEEAVNACLAD